MTTAHIEQFVSGIDFAEPSTARRVLAQLGELGIPAELLSEFLEQLQALLDHQAAPDRVLCNLVRFLENARSPQSWLALFEREPESLTTLSRFMGTSQYIADLLINDQAAFDLVRVTDGQPVDAQVLKDEITAAVSAAVDHKSVLRILREYRHRETLRIAYGDFINGQSVDVVTGQISILAEACLEAAIVGAQAELARKGRPAPRHPQGAPVQFCVLALGKLGGSELNYSSDIDLIFVRERVAATPKWERTLHTDASADEYFQRLAPLVIKLLGEQTKQGIAYRVDMRLRPHGRQGPLVVSYDDAVDYYDSLGRTWERQAFIKARAVAGDMDLGQRLIQELQPWIYRRFLMRADITGLVALKRRIEHRVLQEGEANCNVKLGRGGIRDIEYVIQFLQLLHGADQPSIRQPSTLAAIRQLQASGCLTTGEQTILEDNYRFLRRIEHHLQIMFDSQTHSLPVEEGEFDQFAAQFLGMGENPSEAGAKLRAELDKRSTQDRQILDHLLHNAFANYDYDESQLAYPESDLILDPEPASETIEATLAHYGFADNQAAYRSLQNLAVENIPFLSTRRSRHFLAAIAPQLLAAIAATPDPDATLISLANVSDSLGGKAVLWELFSAHPPSMDLCVRLCAVSPYLTSILTSNPGMIDELLDSLMLDSLPAHEELSRAMDDLCRGAVDIQPMLHSFKHSMHLRVGVRDILGKSPIDDTHGALSDIAEVCMEQVIHHEFHRLVHQLGVPTLQAEDGSEDAAELVVLAVGKLGGREPNYHSDLDVIFLYEGEGQTKSLLPNRRFEPTTNRHFFNQLCQRVIHAVTRSGSTGRLYDLDVRLRPLGRSGQLAITFEDLRHYFQQGQGQIWERQALCKARPIWGSPSVRQYAMQTVRSALETSGPAESLAEHIHQHRMRLQQGAAAGNLKRGIGGTMDVEFVVQLLQLIHLQKHPAILVPGTLQAIQELQRAEILSEPSAEQLREHYQFLRSIESGIRLMNLSARHELPEQEEKLEQLAFLLRSENRIDLSGGELQQQCAAVRRACRSIFDEYFSAWLPAEDDAAVD